MLNEILAQKEFVKCLLCAGVDFKPLHEEIPAIVQCSCGFVYANPRIKKDMLKDFYSREYFENHSSGEMGYDNYVSDRELVEKTFARRLKAIQKKWLKKGGRLLDVGCATGFFLAVARKYGWEVSGVEISEFCGEYALKEFGIKLHQGFFTQAQGLKPGFDLITMWDYIEHSFTPDLDIERAHELLRPGGLLVMATPDMGSLPAKVFKHRWMGFKEHEHLYYFTKKNLKELLVKKGFKIVSTSYAGKYIAPKFFSKRLSEYSKFLGAVSDKILSLPLLNKTAFYCNPFDIVCIVAEKK